MIHRCCIIFFGGNLNDYSSVLCFFFPGNGQTASRSPLITFQDAIRHCQTAFYLEQHMSHIKPTIKHRGMAAVMHKLFGPPGMKTSLHSERDLIFSLALCMFKNDEPVHNHVLQTIYKKLTGTKLDCPRFGNHWELIGFQGIVIPFSLLFSVSKGGRKLLSFPFYDVLSQFLSCIMALQFLTMWLSGIDNLWGSWSNDIIDDCMAIGKWNPALVETVFYYSKSWSWQNANCPGKIGLSGYEIYTIN